MLPLKENPSVFKNFFHYFKISKIENLIVKVPGDLAHGFMKASHLLPKKNTIQFFSER